MTTILNGTKLAKKINKKTSEEILKLNKKPYLVAIQVGKNEESSLYISHKAAKSEEVGIRFEHLFFKKNISLKKMVEKISELNNNDAVNGIMVQLPLPKHIDPKIIAKSIAPEKDVDAFHPLNKGLLDMGNANLIPPTALGVIELLKEYKVKTAGKYVVILGTGEISGKPLSKLFINEKSTVTMCNVNTEDIYIYTKKADILISAVGQKHLITNKDIKKGAVIINIGITKDLDGLHGDVNYEKVWNKASFITPITGGTGPMTVAILLRNTLECFKAKNGKSK